jgi:serpin B
MSLLASAAVSGAQSVSPALANNSLGLDLYRLEAAAQKGNVLLSPFSIQAALCMTFGGADGQTKTEMAKVLHLGGNADAVAKEMATFRATLQKVAEDSARMAEQAKKHGGKYEPLQLHVANRLFGREGYAFLPDFLERTKTEWQAPLEAVNFASAPDQVRQRINGWVEEQTRKRIKDLIPQGGVNAGTRLVLVNALYFKAAWRDEFAPRLTANLPFHTSGTAPVNVPTMHQQEKYGYSKETGFTAVTLPYTGMALHLLVLVPDDKQGLPALEKSLTAEQLTKLSRLNTDRKVKLWLPKFKIEPPTLSLATQLKSLGMKTAFDEPPGSADFSRMAPRKPDEYLTISDVFHKTFMALDENGTEAAAATAVAMTAGSAAPREEEKPAEVRVDRPFLFAIQHRETGLCLFLGRVNDPRAAE